MKLWHPWIFDDTAETSLTRLEKNDQIPLWLNGDLVRNGPGLFNLPQTKLNHWFDGMAVIHKFSFRNGHISYLSKFLQSDAYLAIINQHKIAYGEFATSPKQSLIVHIFSLLKGQITDNNNVNIVKFGKNYLAMTETDHHTLIDPETLLLTGTKIYDDNIKFIINLAHPIIKEENGLLYNLGINFGRISTYNLYQTNLENGIRKIIAKIPTKSPSYMHTFAKTENHFILYENPLRLKLSKLFFANKPFIENYIWTDKAVNFIILDKNGKVLMQIENDAFFCFHVVNSFEDSGKIYLDLITYPNADIIKAFYLKPQIRLDSPNIIPSLYRYVLDLKTASCVSQRLTQASIEFPAINNEYAQKPYNFIYAASSLNHDFQLNALVKIDLANDSYKTWQQEGCFPGEAVFVAEPDTKKEDSGVVISIVADLKNKLSFLLILDAQSFREITRIQLPHLLPMGLHGGFYPTV